MNNLETLADLVFLAVKGWMTKAVGALNGRLDSLEKQLTMLPVPKDGAPGKDAEPIDYMQVRGFVERTVDENIIKLATSLRIPEDGKDGEQGIAGKDGEQGIAGKDGADGLNGKDGEQGIAGKDGADGLNGKDGEQGIAGKDGADGLNGKDGEQGIAGKDGADGLNGKDGANGVDGKSIDEETILQWVATETKAAVVSLPPAKDGVDGKDGLPGSNGTDGLNGLKGKDGQDGQPGQDGKAGERGRDAFELEIIDSIDITKSYPRGTIAKYKGGIIRAYRDTKLINGDLDKAGWSVMMCGIDEIAIEQGDDFRSFGFAMRMTDGTIIDKIFKSPVLLDRGVFKLGTEYQKGDVVTWGGSMWIAHRDTNQKPAETDTDTGWRLSVKKGQPGKDGEPGLPGKSGKDGKNGNS